MADERSLQQIKQDTEAARANLTQTVDQLRSNISETASDIRHRIDPQTIKAEVSDYVKSRGEQLVGSITESARRNPIQAVAVGASVAYPLFRMARAIPMPVLMIGAGLYLAGSKAGQNATQKASNMAGDLADEIGRRSRDWHHQLSQLSDVAGERAQELRDSLSRSAESAKAYAAERLGDAKDRVSGEIAHGVEREQYSPTLSDALSNASSSTAADGFRERVDALRERVSSLGDAANEQAGDLAERAGDLRDRSAAMASDVASSLTDTADRLITNARGGFETAVDAGKDAARVARERATELSQRAGEFGNRASKTVLNTLEENPLLVAGVGLVVGGLIASAIPRSRAERLVVGAASALAKSTVREAAVSGLRGMRDTAGDIYNDARRESRLGDRDPGRVQAAGKTSSAMVEGSEKPTDEYPSGDHSRG